MCALRIFYICLLTVLTLSSIRHLWRLPISLLILMNSVADWEERIWNGGLLLTQNLLFYKFRAYIVHVLLGVMSLLMSLLCVMSQQSVLSNQIWAVRSLIFVVTWYFHALHSKSVARMLIPVFCCFVDGFEGEFNPVSCCIFVSTTIYCSFFYLPPIDLNKSAFKEENSWRLDSEVNNLRRQDSILFFLLGRV